jgi:hypothetical protein
LIFGAEIVCLKFNFLTQSWFLKPKWFLKKFKISTFELDFSGEDDQTTIWNLAMEAEPGQEDLPNVPPQLLFVHMGQKEVKEVQWHKQIPGLAFTTALNGFNLFTTINVWYQLVEDYGLWKLLLSVIVIILNCRWNK